MSELLITFRTSRQPYQGFVSNGTTLEAAAKQLGLTDETVRTSKFLKNGMEVPKDTQVTEPNWSITLQKMVKGNHQ